MHAVVTGEVACNGLVWTVTRCGVGVCIWALGWQVTVPFFKSSDGRTVVVSRYARPTYKRHLLPALFYPCGMSGRHPDRKLSKILAHGVNHELDLLELEEEAILARSRRQCCWRLSLRFLNEKLEHHFQEFHEDASLAFSKRACALTLLALQVIHAGEFVNASLDIEDDVRWPILLATMVINVVVILVWVGFHVWTIRQPTVHGYFQRVLLVMALCVVAIVLVQPARVISRSHLRHHDLTQMQLFLLMALCAISTLWSVQLHVFVPLLSLVVVSLSVWLALNANYLEQQWHIVLLFVASLGMLGRGVYHTETGLRAKFLRVRHLLLENRKLAQQNDFMQLQLSCHVDAIGGNGMVASPTSAIPHGDGGTSNGDSEMDSSSKTKATPKAEPVATGSLRGTPTATRRPSVTTAGIIATPVIGESCMENVLRVLHHVKMQLAGEEVLTRELEYVMKTLTSEQDLFYGSIRSTKRPLRTLRGSLLPKSAAPIEQGESEWLELIDGQKLWRRRRSMDRVASRSASIIKPLRRTTSGYRQSIIRQIQSYLVSAQSRRIASEFKTASGSTLTAAIPVPMPAQESPVRRLPSAAWSADKLLSQAAQSDELDVLAFASACTCPLTSILLTTLESHDLFVQLPIRLEATAQFTLAIESRYQAKNPYHNATHAAFVVWDLNFFLRRLHTELTPLQVLSALLAGAVHDVNHPGRSNAFLVATSSPLAIKYSDDSVLERMHLAETFHVASMAGCDLFHGLSTDQTRQSRQLIILMVLATDLSGHLKHVNKLKSKRYVMHSQSLTDLTSGACASSSPASPPPSCPTTDETIFQTLIMMADLGHAAKSFAAHHAWSSLIAEEFFRQGDVEKQFAMPVSPLCDRDTCKFDRSQIGFFEFVVLPLYTTASDVLPMQFDGILDRIHANLATWRERADRVDQGLPVDTPATLPLPSSPPSLLSSSAAPSSSRSDLVPCTPPPYIPTVLTGSELSPSARSLTTEGKSLQPLTQVEEGHDGNDYEGTEKETPETERSEMDVQVCIAPDSS